MLLYCFTQITVNLFFKRNAIGLFIFLNHQ
jgi:hypothetical protein